MCDGSAGGGARVPPGNRGVELVRTTVPSSRRNSTYSPGA